MWEASMHLWCNNLWRHFWTIAINHFFTEGPPDTLSRGYSINTYLYIYYQCLHKYLPLHANLMPIGSTSIVMHKQPRDFELTGQGPDRECPLEVWDPESPSGTHPWTTLSISKRPPDIWKMLDSYKNQLICSRLRFLGVKQENEHGL